MKTISISDARNHLPSVIEDVAATREQIVVTRYGAPMVAIVPFLGGESGEDRHPLRGHPITLAADFDEPVPELWDALAVAEERSEYSPAKRPRRRRRTTSGQATPGRSVKQRNKG